jgi:hypothetical protein
VEGSAKGPDGNLYLAMALPKGKIFKVTPNGTASIYASFPVSDPNTTAIDFDSVNLRLAFDDKGNMYAPFIDLTNTTTKTPSAYNGVWMIPPGGGTCSLTSGPCTKIWPQNENTTPAVQFLDGVALDGKGSLYVADAQMGNIWKINIAAKTGQLWAGTDAGNNPNYLAGNPADFALGSPIGRGLGVTGLAMDTFATNLYAVTFDTGRTVRIPIKANGSAGTQQDILDLSSSDQELDAIFFDKVTQQLYVTRDETGFIGFVESLPCALSPVPTCSLAPYYDGHEILSTNVAALELGLTKSVTFNPIINNSLLGVTTGVVTAPGLLGDIDGVLYIDVFSDSDGTGAKILRAVPKL